MIYSTCFQLEDKHNTAALTAPGVRLNSAGKTTEEIVSMLNQEHLANMILETSRPISVLRLDLGRLDGTRDAVEPSARPVATKII